MLQELKQARKEATRARYRDWYRRHIPLSTCRLATALAVWWESEKLACMGLRYLEMEYSRSVTRLDLPPPDAAAGADDGAARPLPLPEKWREAFLDKIRTITDEAVRAFEEPAERELKRRTRAKSFLIEVALVDFVEARNRQGRTVSTRAVLERRRFLLDAGVSEAHGKLKKLPRAALKWAFRWQRRHGLSRGRFRTGNGLTPEQQRNKVRGGTVNAGAFFLVVALIGGCQNSWVARSIFGTRQTAGFSFTTKGNSCFFRPPSGFAIRTENGVLGTMGLSASRCLLFDLAQPPDLIS